jgi:hypothetical protein
MALGALKTKGKPIQAPQPHRGGSWQADQKNNVQAITYERSERGSKIRFILPSKSGASSLASSACMPPWLILNPVRNE